MNELNIIIELYLLNTFKYTKKKLCIICDDYLIDLVAKIRIEIYNIIVINEIDFYITNDIINLHQLSSSLILDLKSNKYEPTRIENLMNFLKSFII